MIDGLFSDELSFEVYVDALEGVEDLVEQEGIGTPGYGPFGRRQAVSAEAVGRQPLDGGGETESLFLGDAAEQGP